MPTFTYRHRGSNNEDWGQDTIEAEDAAEAQKKLDEMYAVTRDENGNQTNADMIKVEIVKQ